MGRCALLCNQNEHPKHGHSCFENLAPGTQSINAAGVLGVRANTMRKQLHRRALLPARKSTQHADWLLLRHEL